MSWHRASSVHPPSPVPQRDVLPAQRPPLEPEGGADRCQMLIAISPACPRPAAPFRQPPSPSELIIRWSVPVLRSGTILRDGLIEKSGGIQEKWIRRHVLR
uniref:Uncharacterized protein n=1 Tax=Knipowitschia caucasica TaxID=637954 RepID=A0AAV2KY02_KNICA